VIVKKFKEEGRRGGRWRKKLEKGSGEWKERAERSIRNGDDEEDDAKKDEVGGGIILYKNVKMANFCKNFLMLQIVCEAFTLCQMPMPLDLCHRLFFEP
jgi:hypothetical protein